MNTTNERIVKKIIARDGERERIDSSPEEMNDFIVNGMRDEFRDEKILCIKFIVDASEDMADAESTSWFINPVYTESPSEQRGDGSDNDIDTGIQTYIPEWWNSYGPCMASEFLPELLLLKIPDVFRDYQAFHLELLCKGLTDLPDEEKYEKFIESLKEPY